MSVLLVVVNGDHNSLLVGLEIMFVTRAEILSIEGKT
jgi:hypothetical protein